ncbi:MAG: hypothetical protein R6U50_16760 [Desulfobacterales bacterium]
MMLHISANFTEIRKFQNKIIIIKTSFLQNAKGTFNRNFSRGYPKYAAGREFMGKTPGSLKAEI